MIDKSKIQATSAAARIKGNELAETLEDVRLEVISLKDQRYQSETAIVSIDVANARVDEWIETVKRTMFAKGPRARQFVVSPGRWRRPDEGVADAFSHYLAGYVAAALKADIAAIYEDGDGISEVARALKLEELDERILDAEMLEESIVRAMEDIGIDVIRRPDAAPAAVLAAAAALP